MKLKKGKTQQKEVTDMTAKQEKDNGGIKWLRRNIFK